MLFTPTAVKLKGGEKRPGEYTLIAELHGAAVIKTDALNRKCLADWVLCMFSPCLRGLSLVSSHSPKAMHLRLHPYYNITISSVSEVISVQQHCPDYVTIHVLHVPPKWGQQCFRILCFRCSKSLKWCGWQK